MQQRKLGRTGAVVGVIGLGTAKFGKATPDAHAARIVDEAIDCGATLIDTAHAYGRSEEIIGGALSASGKRDRAFLCTKIQPMANDRASILRQAETSLRRLRTDWIDLLLLHRPNPDIPIDESLRALDDLVRRGWVRYLGTSGFKAWQILEGLQVGRRLGLDRFACESGVYSLLCRYPEVELLPMLETYGVGMTVWSPLGAGVLTDRYTRRDPPGHMDLDEREWRVIEAVRELAREAGCTASQLALAWCARREPVSCVLAGARTVEQLRDNLGAAEVRLDEDTLRRLDDVAPPGWVAMPRWLGLQFGRAHRHAV